MRMLKDAYFLEVRQPRLRTGELQTGPEALSNRTSQRGGEAANFLTSTRARGERRQAAMFAHGLPPAISLVHHC